MSRFWRRLLAGMDNRHEQYRKERVATVFASPIGRKPDRASHADYVEQAPEGGIEAADLPAAARETAMKREKRRRNQRNGERVL